MADDPLKDASETARRAWRESEGELCPARSVREQSVDDLDWVIAEAQALYRRITYIEPKKELLQTVLLATVNRARITGLCQ